MAGEIDTIINEPSDAEKRITSLSDKVKTTAQERDTEKVARETAEKERDFYAGFSDVVSTNPAAKDHKDDIKAKVLAGYSVEDATYAVLGKAGKLGTPQVETQSAAGGSATTSLPSNPGNKTVAEMTQAERRTALQDVLGIN